MTTFGWYPEDGSVRDEDDNVWALIERAFMETKEEGGDVGRILVGPMDGWLDSLLDEDDVQSLRDDDELCAERVCDVVSERHGERVDDGRARMTREGEAAFPTNGANAEIVAWAKSHVELDPPLVCEGRDPLPIRLVDGEWVFGTKRGITQARVDYNYDEDDGWDWCSIVGSAVREGKAASLAEAMSAAVRATLTATVDG